eukprot:8437193-Pyramimonas_sp.AAC.1
MQVRGVRRDGFQLAWGIGQGRPFSPLLFAACSDLYLRRLQRALPGSAIRFVAGDLALATANSRGKLRMLRQFSS